jgi:hypothetical protein
LEVVSKGELSSAAGGVRERAAALKAGEAKAAKAAERASGQSRPIETRLLVGRAVVVGIGWITESLCSVPAVRHSLLQEQSHETCSQCRLHDWQRGSIRVRDL